MNNLPSVYDFLMGYTPTRCSRFIWPSPFFNLHNRSVSVFFFVQTGNYKPSVEGLATPEEEQQQQQRKYLGYLFYTNLSVIYFNEPLSGNKLRYYNLKNTLQIVCFLYQRILLDFINWKSRTSCKFYRISRVDYSIRCMWSLKWMWNTKTAEKKNVKH